MTFLVWLTLWTNISRRFHRPPAPGVREGPTASRFFPPSVASRSLPASLVLGAPVAELNLWPHGPTITIGLWRRQSALAAARKHPLEVLAILADVESSNPLVGLAHCVAFITKIGGLDWFGGFAPSHPSRIKDLGNYSHGWKI